MSLPTSRNNCLEQFSKFFIFFSFFSFFIISVTNSSAQQILVVSGTVSDANGIPLKGATVQQKNTSKATLTDDLGKFTISVSINSSLQISFVGFEEKEIIITNSSPLSVRLEEKASNKLNEVVVVGYGTMKKSDLSGSVSTINTKDISEKSYSNFQQFLSGRAPGVVVQEASGEPGAALSIEIRGMSSLSGSSQPLYVVDGIPFDAAQSPTGSSFAPSTTTNPLAALNPNDIAGIEVLKDASATSIYGSRGANGVVIITTKKGQSGKPRVNFTYNHSLSEMRFLVDRLNANDQAIASNEFNVFRNLPIAYTDDEIKNLKYYDHFKGIGRTGIIRDANVSISGGSNNTKYFLSYQNFDQKGVYQSSGLNRNSFKLSLETEALKNLTLRGIVSYNRTVQNGFPVNPGFGGGLFASALAYSPLVPMLNPDGSYNKVSDYRFGSTLYVDPIFGAIFYNPRFNLQTDVLPNVTQEPGNNTFVLIREYKSVNTTQQLIGNFDATYKISSHLKLNGKVGVISGQGISETYRPRALPVETTWRGMANISNIQTMKLLYESTINYNNKFGKHRLDGVVGATAETYEIKSFSVESREFPNDVTGFYNIGAGSVLLPPSSNYEANQLVSFLGRLNYNYGEKYLFTFTGRYDGSSKFAEGNRFGFFPSVAASWRISREDFMKRLFFLSDWKVRASYGIIGNQAVANYATLPTLVSGMNYGFGSIVNPGYASSRVPNPNLTWEESKQINLGTDISLFNFRVNISADVYKKTTEKLLFNAQTPLTLGFPTMTQNVGAMENKGLEIIVSTVNIKKAFNWRTDFNIGFNRNRITALNGNVKFLQNGTAIGGMTRAYINAPIGEIYAYRTLPVWNDQTLLTKPSTFQPGARPGDVRFDDINGDGRLDDGDLLPFGNALPKFTGGIGNNLSYKGFDLNVFISFSYGAYAYNAFLASMANVGGNNSAYKFFKSRYRDVTPNMDTKTAEQVLQNNLITHFPRAGTTGDVRIARDYYVEETSYARINNITLGYSLSSSMNKRAKIQNARIYITLQNPLILTNYSGINPEGTASNTSINRGIDTGGYPLARTVSLGTNITF